MRLKTAWPAWLGLWVAGAVYGAEPLPVSPCAAVGDGALPQVFDAMKPLLAAHQVELELIPIGRLPEMATPKIQLLSREVRSRVVANFSGKLCGQSRSSTVTVWFKAKVWSQVWVYGRNGRAEQPVALAQPTQERVDLAAAQVALGDLAEQVDDAWLNQSVNAGMPILKRHLKAQPLVLRDAPVTVVVLGPGLMLRTEGTALRPGVLGERVPVILNGARSSLVAVVTGKGEVHVER